MKGRRRPRRSRLELAIFCRLVRFFGSVVCGLWIVDWCTSRECGEGKVKGKVLVLRWKLHSEIFFFGYLFILLVGLEIHDCRKRRRWC